jgi:hypothetical protein
MLIVLLVLAAIAVAASVFLRVPQRADSGIPARRLSTLLLLATVPFLAGGGEVVAQTAAPVPAWSADALLWAALTVVLIGFALFAARNGWWQRKASPTERVGVATQDVERNGAQAAPLAPVNPGTGSIFISYRRRDSSDATGRIYDRLVSHFSRECVFKDVDSIPLGVDFRKHLADSVGRCQIVLTVIGPNWLADDPTGPKGGLGDPRDFVRLENEAAFQRNIPVIPVLVQGAAMPQAEQLPPSLESLAYHNGIPIRADPDFHPDMARLIKGIEAHFRVGGSA